MNKENNIILGILFMTLAMFCLSVNDVLVKGLSSAYPIWEVIFFRAFSGVIISVVLIFFFGWQTLKTKKPLGHLIRAFSSVACVVFYFFGLKYLMLSENVAIVHSAPILATLLAVPILGEKLGLHRIVAVVLGFIGVLIIVKPGSGLFKIESLFPLAAAFFMAVSYLATRFLMSTESSVAIIFYYSLALLITSLVFFPDNFVIPSVFNLIPLMGLGIMGSLGHYFMAQAAKSAEVVVITPFEYTSFIFLGVMGYFFYGEVPDSSVYIGMLLIILSGIYIVYREQQKKKSIVSHTILKNTR
jgi:drug/metabolite transporter (DMT)-like permease